ncbi:MAG: hypothetical protein ABIQ59_17810 [Nocardioidaceae bacterium]
MSWVGPVARNAAKYGAKYGPHAKVAWEVGGKHVQAAVRARFDEAGLRRTAVAQAEGTQDGTVLRLVDQGETFYVVFAGEDPVASYPSTEKSLAELVAKKDLSKRRTPEAIHEQELRNRVRRAGGKVRRPRKELE